MRARRVREVLADGRPLHGARVVAFLAPGSGEVAFVASRRVGGAVTRNRARRVMRAAWAEIAPRVRNGSDIAWVARSGIARAKTQDVVAEMSELLQRAEAMP